MQIPDGYWSEDPLDASGVVPYVCLLCGESFSPWWPEQKSGDLDAKLLCSRRREDKPIPCWTIWFRASEGGSKSYAAVATAGSIVEAAQLILADLEKL